MTTLHAFGCSITQGFALPDVVKPMVNSQGQPLTEQELERLNIHWSDIHLYQPSSHAWPQVLGDMLGVPVANYARRGACFNQISRQCAVAVNDIKPNDIVIVMWTYLSRLSLQWPTRTAVPFCNIADRARGWQTVILGFNKFFGLERADHTTAQRDRHIQQFIHDSAKHALEPMGMYNRYYNSLVLQSMTDGFLRATGARVIHLSVETESALDQLALATRDLDQSLKESYVIPDPKTWYTMPVDHTSCRVILDPSIPPAENDMHPSVQHHSRFAHHIYDTYFRP